MLRFNSLPNKEKISFTYAGIGSRKTPPDVLRLMGLVAKRLEERGYTLRTGNASGADQAFRDAVLKKEVFYPNDANDLTREIAREIHPKPQALKPFTLDLQARNCFQVFGADLSDPVDFVVCWTPDGMEHHSQRSKGSGGTAQAISMASLKGIPVINMKNEGWKKKIKDILDPPPPDPEQLDLFS